MAGLRTAPALETLARSERFAKIFVGSFFSVWCTFSLAAVISAGRALYADGMLDHGAQLTVGTILSRDSENQDCLEVRYRIGEVSYRTSSCGNWARLPDGDPVDIEYAPAAPERARVRGGSLSNASWGNVVGASFFLVVGLAFVGFLAMFAQFWVGRQMRRCRPRRIAEARPGELVKLTGHIRLRGRPLIAPASGAPCAAWRLRVEEDSSDGGKLFDTNAATDFVIDDGSGQVAIVFAELTSERRGLLNLDREPVAGETPAMSSLFDVQMSPARRAMVLKSRRVYLETRLGEGDLVTVYGRMPKGARRHAASAGGNPYRDGAAAAVPVLVGAVGAPLVLTRS